eukprot:gene2296-8584_t
MPPKKKVARKPRKVVRTPVIVNVPEQPQPQPAGFKQFFVAGLGAGAGAAVGGVAANGVMDFIFGGDE